jgi:hypothetical protein
MAGGNAGLFGIVVMSHVCSSFFEAGVAVRAIARIAPRASAMRFWRRSVGVERDDVAASIARRPPDDAEKGIARSLCRPLNAAGSARRSRAERKREMRNKKRPSPSGVGRNSASYISQIA